MAFLGLALLLFIPHMTSGCPGECACYGSTIDCSFRMLASVPRGLPADAEWLRLDYNQLTYLSHTDFPNSDSIARLCLNDNSIRNVSRGTFDHFPRLQMLSLHGNLLQSIPWGGFDRLSNLIMIRLYNNPWNCQQIDVLYLSHWIKTHKDLFDEYDDVSCSTGLMYVKDVKDLDFEVMTNDSKTFPTIPAIKTSIASPADDFRCPFYGCHCRNETVDCTNKKYCSIPPGVPQTTRILNMKHNNIQFINAKAFYTMQELQLLDLSHNEISSLSNETFYGLTNLRKLFISFNKLKILDRSLLLPLTGLEQLHLNNNQLRCLHQSAFNSLKKLRFLNLSSNNLSEIHKGTFNSLNSLEGINLTINFWNCKCKHILHLVHWMKDNTKKAMLESVMCAGGHKRVVAVSRPDVSHHHCLSQRGVEDCNLGQHLRNSSSGHENNRNSQGINSGALHKFSFKIIFVLFSLTQWARV
uniref:Slit homolog 1 protein-like n=3 Tax=Petromyzon marinus TaxID=7757 RepID=A0AAJ7T7J3_PETMA|nr:slit homolog 1 protein-like [Petromyzon marinus]XP_032812665.1 slit homolog 1 protein-like [Petromyzon marinus]XP_032812666.1 slit homolog 1 protein-like [Petromyzon marinus]